MFYILLIAECLEIIGSLHLTLVPERYKGHEVRVHLLVEESDLVCG